MEQLLHNALHAALSRITRETGLVGGAVQVIRGGQVVFRDTYGYADRDAGRPMTQDTLFDVASCSKAWTAMLAAQAVDAGLLDWDAPIQRYLPEFTMTDPYAGAHLSARDLASHRSGLPGHDFLRNKISGDRKNLMLKTAGLELSMGFRGGYQYNNHLFILLGYLEEVLRGGMSWEEQIRTHIAQPLGIDPIRFRGQTEGLAGLDIALPYCSDGYRAQRCGYASNAHSAPCGGIRISMENMSKWLIAMSRGGALPGGGRLCSAEQFRQLITPVIPTPDEDCALLRSSCYALAWHTADYLGHPVVFHSGGLTGFNTQVGFLPEDDCAYVMSFNTGTTPASEVARAIVLDTLTRGAPQPSYDDMIDAWLKRRDDMRAKVRGNAEGTPITAHSDPALMGVYRHPAYETFSVEAREDQRLWFVYGDFEAPLQREADGLISGYSGVLDSLTPEHIELYPQPDGNLRLRTSDSDLKMLFVREV